MKPINCRFAAIIIIAALAAIPCFAQEDLKVVKIVEQLYPNLTSGALAYAELTQLPEGTLLKADGIKVTSESITKIIESQPQQSREQLKKNTFFILEQEATNQILLYLAKKTSTQSDKEISDKGNTALIQQYFEKEVFKKVDITDKELKAFYEKNKDMCGSATLEQIAPSLKEYLISQKKQQMASDYIQTLGKRVSMQVSESWVKKQAAIAFDNPVDKARKSKKPSLVDFGSTGCIPCDIMTPILATLKKKYEGKLNVLFVHVGKERILASRYGVRSIPLQVFFDKEGKEVFRHVGVFSLEEIEKKLAILGIK